jgi:hypothetical protein
MPSTTPIQGFRIPVSTDDPDIVDDMTQLAKAIEKRVVGIYASASDRDTKVAGNVEEGMFAFTKDTNSFWYHDGTNWVGFPTVVPVIRSGTGNPVNSTGIDGDVYIKY